MKTASNVFSVIGIFTNAFYCISGMIQIEGSWFIFVPLLILSIIFAIAGLASQEKKIGLGIAMILFVNPLAGIFYLCWDGR